MVIALAGRRVDAPNAKEARFPSEKLDVVKSRLHELFKRRQATVLVCSAACGSDLLALEAAGDLGIRRTVVLPYGPDIFRRTSVVDRPGDWGEPYEQIVDQVQKKDDLVILGYAEDDPGAYSATNLAILDYATKVAREATLPIAAVIVWDGKSRGKEDFTEQFRNEARSRGIEVVEVRTLE